MKHVALLLGVPSPTLFVALSMKQYSVLPATAPRGGKQCAQQGRARSHTASHTHFNPVSHLGGWWEMVGGQRQQY